MCTGAIRNEGVSHHYAPTEKFARPSETITNRLTQAQAAGGTEPQSGVAWTIDAPYQETVAEARSYQAEGVVCVEVEAAALFTVANTAASMWPPPSSSAITFSPRIAGLTPSALQRSAKPQSGYSTPPCTHLAGMNLRARNSRFVIGCLGRLARRIRQVRLGRCMDGHPDEHRMIILAVRRTSGTG